MLVADSELELPTDVALHSSPESEGESVESWSYLQDHAP